MKNQAKYSSIFMLLIGVVIGGLVFSHMMDSSEPQVYSRPAPSTTAVEASRDRTITTLRDLNNAFVDIAEAVTPTVVTVFTEKVRRVQQTPFHFFSDPFEFFGRDFFSSPRRRRREPEEREYRQQGLGSGVIVSADGYILTNNHVVEGADSIYVRTNQERTFPAKVIGTDPKTDIAVIKVEAKGLHAIKKGDSDRLRVGEWVLAIGSPLSANLAHTVTQGIVSAKGRSNVGLADYEDFIQTDAAINPGNSGGALVNLDGELVGINTAIASRSGGFQGIGFAVPINMAGHVMESLIEHGKVVRGWLGVTIQDINEQMAKAMDLESTEGALVSDVVKKSPAEKAGLQPEDVILRLNGETVKNTTQLRNNIAAIDPGTKVTLTILRQGRTKQVVVTLGELPADISSLATARRGLEDLLGFTVETMNRQLANQYNLDADQKGVVVTDIDRSSPAYRAGLREGDLIRSVNRTRVRTESEFRKRLQNVQKGDTILLQVVRETGRLYLAFDL